MAEDYTLYPDATELSISCVAKINGLDIGDIVNVRDAYDPHRGGLRIGTGRKTVGWIFRLLVTGLTDDQISVLTSPIENPNYDPEQPRSEANLPVFEKRRYCVPLSILKEMFPGFDEARVLDSTDEYEPFRPLDPETKHALDHAAPISYEGLIYDKQTETFME